MGAKEIICQECGQKLEDVDQFHPNECCISFKAGQEAEKAHWTREIGRQVHDAYEGGIQTVVEWVDKHIAFGNIPASYKEWQAFKKSKMEEDWEQGSEETRESLAKGQGITFPTGEEAIKWLTDGGRINREPCALCGQEQGEAHHEDYNEPLLIVWLCKQCHHQVHNLLKKQAEEGR